MVAAAWPMKDVQPCFQLARMVTELRCNLEAGEKHLRAGNVDGARSALVSVYQTAKDLADAHKPSRKAAERLRSAAGKVVEDLGGKPTRKKREEALRAASSLRPRVSELFERGAKECRT